MKDKLKEIVKNWKIKAEECDTQANVYKGKNDILCIAYLKESKVYYDCMADLNILIIELLKEELNNTEKRFSEI